MTAYAVEVADLRKTYGDYVAVDGISFAVSRGEVFGMLGPNGAGKTTTVECVIGLRQPDAGSIQVLGLTQGRSGGRAIRARLGVQLQSTGLLQKLTVRETLELFATFYPRPLPAADLIALAGLEEKAGARTGTLSGGQRQRLTLAMALVNDPDVVFLDEPTTAMDPQARRSVWDLIRGLRDRGKAVVLTTHYMEEAAALCNRVAVVDHGKVIALGPPAELVRQHFAETAVEFATPAGLPLDRLTELAGVTRTLAENGTTTLFSTAVPETVSSLLGLARQHGFSLDHFTVRGATLEDLFLRLTGRRIRN